MEPRVESVFVPGTQPSYTYVDRGEKRFEQKLRRGLRTPGKVVSISGPSKSGKTVLVRNVVDDDTLVKVALSGIDSVGGLWRKVLDELGAPAITEKYTEKASQYRQKGDLGLVSNFQELVGETPKQKSVKPCLNHQVILRYTK